MSVHVLHGTRVGNLQDRDTSVCSSCGSSSAPWVVGRPQQMENNRTKVATSCQGLDVMIAVKRPKVNEGDRSTDAKESVNLHERLRSLFRSLNTFYGFVQVPFGCQSCQLSHPSVSGL